MIEAFSFLFAKFTLPLSLAAWTYTLASGDLCGAAVAVPVVLLLAGAIGRSGRLRGKRAEGWP